MHVLTLKELQKQANEQIKEKQEEFEITELQFESTDSGRNQIVSQW